MKKHILYLECFSGISGDMTVAALLDLGVDKEYLLSNLKSLCLDGYGISIGRREKCSIDACSFDVHLHQGGEDHEHKHHEHGHHEHGRHEHRNIHSVYEIIDRSSIAQRAKDCAKRIFDVVAQAEARAHGIPIEKVHFHEVGAVDSIVDIVAVAVCMQYLEIEEVVVSTLFEGQGHAMCQHGILPVPVPAVAQIISKNGLQIKITSNEGEMITPTGAAIAAALKTRDALPDSFRVLRIGLGAGKKDFPKANILRAMLLEEETIENGHKENEQSLYQLETNVDDSTPEALSFAMEQLFSAGAKEVYFTPVYMKKNRPGTLVTVLCEQEKKQMCEAVIFRNLTTIGMRISNVERVCLEREIVEKDTPYGKCHFKICIYDNMTYAYPEYEDVKRICLQQALSFEAVYSRLRSLF